MGRRKRKERGPPFPLWGYLAGVTVVAVAVSLGALTLWDGGGDGGVGPVILPSPLPTEIPREGHVLGRADAPVTLVEYADFQ